MKRKRGKKREEGKEKRISKIEQGTPNIEEGKPPPFPLCLAPDGKGMIKIENSGLYPKKVPVIE